LTEEVSDPGIPRVNSELLEKIRDECKTLRFQDRKYQKRSTPSVIIGGAGMIAFALILALMPNNQNRIYYQASSFAVMFGSFIVAYTI
jgi:hypothetical protein